ncbi:hypothetical protein HPP92_004036 [Vanilla planifolia]|uniref:Uncharacterized protein n=1 Tax=Vanilla planifolia TaxID=51239 RepID=A0A835VJI9_VANPL|nr:hypothetical protein HPP92_004036 [Vanilla planifolia]
MVKVRIQLRQGSAVQVPKNMLAQEGFGAFYKPCFFSSMNNIYSTLEATTV